MFTQIVLTPKFTPGTNRPIIHGDTLIWPRSLTYWHTLMFLCLLSLTHLQTSSISWQYKNLVKQQRRVNNVFLVTVALAVLNSKYCDCLELNSYNWLIHTDWKLNPICPSCNPSDMDKLFLSSSSTMNFHYHPLQTQKAQPYIRQYKDRHEWQEYFNDSTSQLSTHKGIKVGRKLIQIILKYQLLRH